MSNPKVVNAIDESIKLATGQVGSDDIVGMPFIPWMARSAEVTPPWWSFNRDVYLRDFWKRSSHLSTMMYTAQSLLTNIPMRVVAKDPSITSHVEQAEDLTEILWKASEFGETLFAAKRKFSEDYLSQDNGGFLEVIGNGRPDGPLLGLPVSVRHLDSRYCWRTRNPEFPVVYHDPEDGGKAYKLHRTRVIAMSQMSSSERGMNGVGFSAVSRSLQFAQHLYDIYIFKQEKLGSRPIHKILVGAGFRGSHLMQAVAVATEANDNANLSRYAKVVGIGSDDVQASIKSVDLNNFDPFDEETSVTLAMYGLSASFGIPIQEVWPAPASRSGRSGDVQESRQTGKLPAEFNAELDLNLSEKYLPRHLKIKSDWNDDYQDEREAVNQDIRARNRERDLNDGAITVRVARELMVNKGDISRDQFALMELDAGRLENGKSIGSLFYAESEPYATLLDIGVEHPAAVLQNDKDEIMEAVDLKKSETYAEMSMVNSARKKRKLQECLAALKWLEDQYEEEATNIPPQLQAFEDRLAAGEVDAEGNPIEDSEPASEQADEPASEQEAGDDGEQAGEQKPQGRDPDEVRPGSVEGKGLSKQGGDIDEVLEQLRKDLAREFEKEEPDRSKVKEIVLAALLISYLAGAHKVMDDLTDEDREIIEGAQEKFISQLNVIFDRSDRGVDMKATIDRIANQASGLYWAGFSIGGPDDEKLTWMLGPTRDHCADCQGNDGQTKTRREWRDGGRLPQSPGLACTGRYCLCALVPEL